MAKRNKRATVQARRFQNIRHNVRSLRNMGFDFTYSSPTTYYDPTRGSLAAAKRSSRLRSGFRLSSPLLELEDLRHEKPQELQQVDGLFRRHYAAGPDGVAASVVQRDKPFEDTLSGRLSSRVRSVFADTRRSLVCVRRRARRAVLLALSHRGGGAAKPFKRPAKWTEQSYIDCK